MKKSTTLLFLLTSLFNPCIFSQYSYVSVDSFHNKDSYHDLSVLLTRNGFDEPATSFVLENVTDTEGLGFNALRLNENAIGKCGYSFDKGEYMTHSAIDFEFPLLDRSDEDTIRIEFDALWETTGGSGESGRAVVFLISDYPEEGPVYDDYMNLSGHPFGRPAYNIRLLNGSYGAFMCYGGGKEEEGVFEIVNSKYWLPGFSSLAGGGTIGQGENYPVNAFMETPEGTKTVSTTNWKHYTWELAYERQSLYWRNVGETADKDELLLFMEIPADNDLSQINEAHGSFVSTMPPLYHWFEEIKALRFYWRGNNNFALANVVVSKTGEPVNTWVEFSKNKIRVNESDKEAELLTLISNPDDNNPTTVKIDLEKGDSRLIDNFTTGIIDFSNGQQSPSALHLRLTGDEDMADDTLIFRITQVSGGKYASIYGKDSLMLIIRNENITGNIHSLNTKPEIFPNPCAGPIQIKGLPAGNSDIYYELINLTGEILSTGIINRNSPVIPVNKIKSGLYFIRLRCDNQFFIERLILTRRQ